MQLIHPEAFCLFFLAPIKALYFAVLRALTILYDVLAHLPLKFHVYSYLAIFPPITLQHCKLGLVMEIPNIV